MPPPRVKLSQGERSKIKNNLIEINDTYQPLVNEVGFLMSTVQRVRSRAENLDDFADSFGTKQMKGDTTRLARKMRELSIALDIMHDDLIYTEGKSKNVLDLFEKYEEFCQKGK
jgi:hypothetical protein